MTDELIPLEPIVEIAPAPFVISAELQAALDDAEKIIEGRTFSDRHPELGKMISCRVCGTRHRKNEKKCEQVFTYRVDEDNSNTTRPRLAYELYRENEKGELVPDYRTAMRPDEKPTQKQVMGAASFAKKRYHPHLSKIKLQFIQRTRKVFEELGFPLERVENEEIKDFNAKFQENLQRARILAARELRSERELRDRAARRRADQARRINRGLLVTVRA